MTELSAYPNLLQEIKQRIAHAQTRAVMSANTELIRLYWDIGWIIGRRQQEEGWGSGFIPKLAEDLRNELPEVKGFSERNSGYMLQFAREYGDSIEHNDHAVTDFSDDALQQSEDDALLILQQLVAKIPWGHNILLMSRVKDHSTRLWYVLNTLEQGWSRNILAHMIEAQLHQR